MSVKQTTISFTEAKANLSKIGRLAEHGTTTLVLKHRRPSFLISPVPPEDKARPKKPGAAHGQIHMSPDFDVTPEDVVRDFEGTV
jgi:antitoxin (DNA-binding transcriptional repressor) of toxin-antitoxin stability system